MFDDCCELVTSGFCCGVVGLTRSCPFEVVLLGLTLPASDVELLVVSDDDNFLGDGVSTAAYEMDATDLDSLTVSVTISTTVDDNVSVIIIWSFFDVILFCDDPSFDIVSACIDVVVVLAVCDFGSSDLDDVSLRHITDKLVTLLVVSTKDGSETGVLEDV